MENDGEAAQTLRNVSSFSSCGCSNDNDERHIDMVDVEIQTLPKTAMWTIRDQSGKRTLYLDSQLLYSQFDNTIYTKGYIYGDGRGEGQTKPSSFKPADLNHHACPMCRHCDLDFGENDPGVETCDFRSVVQQAYGHEHSTTSNSKINPTELAVITETSGIPQVDISNRKVDVPPSVPVTDEETWPWYDGILPGIVDIVGIFSSIIIRSIYRTDKDSPSYGNVIHLHNASINVENIHVGDTIKSTVVDVTEDD